MNQVYYTDPTYRRGEALISKPDAILDRLKPYLHQRHLLHVRIIGSGLTQEQLTPFNELLNHIEKDILDILGIIDTRITAH